MMIPIVGAVTSQVKSVVIEGKTQWIDALVNFICILHVKKRQKLHMNILQEKRMIKIFMLVLNNIITEVGWCHVKNIFGGRNYM